MSLSEEEEKKQKQKNYVMLFIIFGFVAIVFAVTMIRMKMSVQ